ncbi:MAG: DNA-binding protein [Clostridia bacterium]|nr:DNA-binding protein [Clostridia bacterium]
MPLHEKDLEIGLLLDFYGELLSDSRREAAELYYNEDLSLAEIAENTGITRQGVRDSINKAKAQLYSYEEKLGLAGKFRQVEKTLADLTARLERLRSVLPEEERGELDEIIRETQSITI